MIVARIKAVLFTPNLILMFIVVSEDAYAQQQIAIDTYGIFQQSCLICHGPDGAYKESLLMEHNALIKNGSVVPGNPDASELYKRLITTETAKRMPLGQPQLSPQAINTIRNWIAAGAPDWAQTPTTDRAFIAPGEILTTIETHLMSLSPFDRAYARYFTMTHLMNAGEPTSILDEYRKGLNKLVNSLSWGSTITKPQPIDARETIFYIDLRHYEWDVNDAWTAIEAEYPYHIGFNAPEQSGLKAQLGRLQQEMKADIPSIHVDWFIAQASLPPLYHDLLSLPLTDRELDTKLDVDVARNILNAPGVRVLRAGTNKSGVSNHNRVIERHTSRYGAYWKSYDFAGSVGTQNIFTHPLSFTHDGGEVVFNLPNGLQGYYITTAAGSRLDAAPIQIVSNPAASDPTVRNGISCFGCHTEGIKTFEDEVRAVIESNDTPAYDKAQALRLYVAQGVMDGLITEDMKRYRLALEATGGAVDDIEPISRFHEAYQGPIDAAYAAGVVGLETEVFLAKVRENVALQQVGLLVLDSANGSMKRDAWTSSFPDILFALDFPKLVDKPPVVPDPDRLPGAFVHIPDTKLRAAIAEVLGKSPNAPIAVEEMEGLDELRVSNRGIRDLTGLQFAINLDELILEDNEISDLSPLAGLINLERLYLAGNPISNLSHVKGLTNLVEFNVHRTLVTDLSPLAGLINLTNLAFSNENLSDISPLAGLINLRKIFSWGHAISDLSPLAGLTKLERINFCGGAISDLTPLAGLTGLTRLYLAGEKISDISPIARLTGLTRLSLSGNDISDISPLSHLTNLTWIDLDLNKIVNVQPLENLNNLTWLNIRRNNILDISPLKQIRENLKVFIWYDNPAFPQGGPKIEGPWLWLILHNEKLSKHLDLIQKATKGKITETEIATNGAIAGQIIRNEAWTLHKLPNTGDDNNIRKMLGYPIPNSVIYGSIHLYSPRRQETTMYVANDNGLKVWLNGNLVYEYLEGDPGGGHDYEYFFPVTLQAKKNIILVAIQTENSNNGAYFGFEPGTEYTTANPGVGYAFSPTPIHTGETFTLDIRAENVFDMAGWQFDIAFDRNVLEAISVSEADFLKQNGANALFQGGSINNEVGKITGLSAVRLAPSGVSGTGKLVQVSFKAKRGGDTKVALQNLQFANITGDSLPAGPHEIAISIKGQLLAGDVNRDGQITVADLILVAAQLGKRVPTGTAEDVNGDGIVNMLDLLFVTQAIDSPAAPIAIGRNIDAATIEGWIAQARLEDDGSLIFKQGIAMLETLLASLIPKSTALLGNYPNPFNPETWLPYQLAEDADVRIAIYDATGQLVRRLDFGYQRAGYYTDRSKAAYWDGRNDLGESVGSGIYFYQITAGNYSFSRKLVILK